MIPLSWHRRCHLDAMMARQPWRPPRQRRSPPTVERFEDRTLLAARLVSADGAGTDDLDSRYPVLGANGRVVALVSFSTDLVATNDLDDSFDVLAGDLQTGTTTLVSGHR